MHAIAIFGAVLWTGAAIFLWWLTQGHLLNSDWDQPAKKFSLTWQRLCWTIGITGFLLTLPIGFWLIPEAIIDFNTSNHMYTEEEVRESYNYHLFCGVAGLIFGIVGYLAPPTLKAINFHADKKFQKYNH